jgi:hypothetical protein
MLIRFWSCGPGISLEPTVQGPIEGFTGAARYGVEDAARVIPEWFEREPEDA